MKICVYKMDKWERRSSLRDCVCLCSSIVLRTQTIRTLLFVRS